MSNVDYESKTFVLKVNLDEFDAKKTTEQKKTSVFKSLFSKPKPDEVNVASTDLIYEGVLYVSGTYTADYYRKATHEISVDHNVSEVVLGDGTFPIREKSKFAKILSGKKGKNKVDIQMEEHAYIVNSDSMYFDQHGTEIKFPFKLDSKNLENYPTRILQKNESGVKKPNLSAEDAMEKLKTKLKQLDVENVRDLKEDFTIDEVYEIYVPIYESRIVGPKKKVELLRIDAVRNKIL